MEVKGDMHPDPKCPPSSLCSQAWAHGISVRCEAAGHGLAAMAAGATSSGTICVPCLPWESKRGVGVSEPGECVVPPSFPSIHPATQSWPSSQGPAPYPWASIPTFPLWQPLAQEWRPVDTLDEQGWPPARDIWEPTDSHVSS